jgi:hypothetical protein
MMLVGWRSDEMLSRYAASTAVERAHEAHRRLALDRRRYPVVSPSSITLPDRLSASAHPVPGGERVSQ